MKLFIDTGNIKDIEKLCDIGIIDGVTTNPTLLAKEPGDFRENLKKICGIVKGPVSGEVTATDFAGMLHQGHDIAKIDQHMIVKAPLTREGIKACKALSGEGIRGNVTLCFSPAQALLAAKAGAFFGSPFGGRPSRGGSGGPPLAPVRSAQHEAPSTQVPSPYMDPHQTLAGLERRADLGGGEARQKRQHDAGKLTARERITLLFDPGTFEEVDKLVTHRCRDFGMEHQLVPGDGVVAGHGLIDGRQVVAFAQDFTVFGRSLWETNSAKLIKIMELAMKLGAPVARLNETCGAIMQER